MRLAESGLDHAGRRIAIVNGFGRRLLAWPARDKVIVGLSLLLFCALVIDPLILRAVRDLDPQTRGFFRAITDLGKSGWILISSAAVVACLLALRAGARSARERAVYGYASQLASFVFLCVAVAGIVGSLAKNIIGRARPKHFDAMGALDFSPFAFKADLASFPSGHGTTIFALATALALLWPRWSVPVYAVAGWVAVSRVIIGAHYLADAVGGALLGTAIVLLIRDRLARRRWLFASGPEGPALRGRRLRHAIARKLAAWPSRAAVGADGV